MKSKFKLRIKKQDTMYYFLVLSLILDNELFYLFSIDSTILVLFNLFLIFFLFIKVAKTNAILIKECNKLIQYIIVVFLFLFVQYIYTVIKYNNQTIANYLKAARGFLYIPLAVPLLLMLKKNGIERILNMIEKVTIISLTIILIFAVLYNFLDIKILNVAFYKMPDTRPAGLYVRNNRLRLWDLSTTEGLVALWTFYKFLECKSSKIKNALTVALIVFTLVYVENTRAMQVSIVVSMATMYILSLKRTPKSKMVASSIGIIVIGFLVAYSGAWTALIDNFSTTGIYGNSTSVRIAGVKYALYLIVMHPINGVGLALKEISDVGALYNGWGRFSYTDIGIIGFVAEVGLWSLLIFFIPMARIIYIANKSKTNKYYLFLVGIVVYLIFTSVTLAITDIQRIYLWPFILSVFEYIHGEKIAEKQLQKRK